MQDEKQLSEPPPEKVVQEQFAAGRKSGLRKRQIAIFVVAILVSIGLLVLLGSQLLTPAQNQTNAQSSTLIGRPAPNFTLPMLDTRQPFSLASLKGKPVVLNFWASWCVPCQQEAPLLEKTWRSVQRQGVALLGIDFQDARSDGLNFLHKYGITYPSVADDTGDTAINYGLTGVPETFFINRQGVIVAKVTGQLTEQSLQSNLKLIER